AAQLPGAQPLRTRPALLGRIPADRAGVRTHAAARRGTEVPHPPSREAGTGRVLRLLDRAAAAVDLARLPGGRAGLSLPRLRARQPVSLPESGGLDLARGDHPVSRGHAADPAGGPGR